MRTATDRMDPRRRRLLGAIAAAPLLKLHPARAAANASPVLVATWADAAGRYEIGVIQLDGNGIHVLHRVEAPTRAHGLACTRDGQVIAVARRPGDWIVR